MYGVQMCVEMNEECVCVCVCVEDRWFINNIRTLTIL